jgi:predicted acylesterase/phospholipase RssA
MPTENVPQKRFGEIALCLSGGGYRAATFALGTLDMLDELHLLDDVKLLSTVSGGTFTGLNYALSQVENKTFGEFYDDFGDFLKRTNVIIKALRDLYNTPSPSGSTDVSLIRSAAHVYSGRDFLGEKTFGQLTEIVGKDARFKELIFNATEFHTGNGFRFRASWDDDIFIGNQIFSVPKDVAGEMHLADIAAASSCFPGAFEPIRFPDDFYWQSPLNAIRGELIKDVTQPFPPHNVYKNGFNDDGKCIPLPLMDGGIFDNQGITSAVLADTHKIFKLFLISDTSPRENDILNFPDASPRRGWFTLETLLWIAVAIFILSLAAIGLIAYSFFVPGAASGFADWQIIVAYIVSVLPAFILIGMLIWAYGLFDRAKTIIVSGAKFPLWRFFKHLALPDAIVMVKARINSLVAMTADVFMKRIRQLQFNNLMNPESRKKQVSFNLIYSIAAAPEHSSLWILDPELRPTEQMKSISECAEGIPTTLWMTDEEFQVLIACGRCTTCFSLLKFLWRRWQEQQAEAYRQKTPYEIPKPNDPSSPYYEIYTYLKTKWLELKKDPYDGQARERV